MFKKIIISTLLVGTGMGLGCATSRDVSATGNELEIQYIESRQDISSYILTDNETNVQYIVIRDTIEGGISITPRLDKNGKLYIKNK